MDASGITRIARAMALLFVGVGCNEESSTGPARQSLQINSVISAPENGLTARVSLRVSGFDSVRIRYQSMQDPARTTPAIAVRGDSLSVRVAGLAPDQLYQFQSEGWRQDRLVAGSGASFQSAPLPPDLTELAFQRTIGTPTPGYTMVTQLLGTVGYLVIFDSVGVIRWYRNTNSIYPGAAPGHLEQLPNGNLVAFIGGTRGFDPLAGRFYEFNLDGEVVRTYGAAPPLYTDNHDLLINFTDSVPTDYTLFSYDIRSTDLTAYGGAADVAVAGHQLLRNSVTGGNLFFWNAWDNFSLADWIEEPQSSKLGSNADFDHPNSLSLDLDGSYVVSWRSMAEITKIDALTGRIVWRWGGLNNEFTFVNDSKGFFSGQHSVKVLPNGHYLIYDNGLRHSPPETRIAEYQLDQTGLTATLVWEYHHSPAYYTPFLGWTERLAGGNTFIGWGGIGILQEVAADKSTVWEAELRFRGAPSVFYRARRITDLYRGH